MDKPQLGGVGIVFQGTDDGGLKVSLIDPISLPRCIEKTSPTPPAPHSERRSAMQTLAAFFVVALVICDPPLHFTCHRLPLSWLMGQPLQADLLMKATF